MPPLKKLLADEHAAVKDYGTAINNAKTPKEAEALRHIRSEEKHHAEELKGLMSGLGAEKPRVNELSIQRAQGGYIANQNGEDHVLADMPAIHKHLETHLGDE
jgi:rubrerythrin